MVKYILSLCFLFTPLVPDCLCLKVRLLIKRVGSANTLTNVLAVEEGKLVAIWTHICWLILIGLKFDVVKVFLWALNENGVLIGLSFWFRRLYPVSIGFATFSWFFFFVFAFLHFHLREIKIILLLSLSLNWRLAHDLSNSFTLLLHGCSKELDFVVKLFFLSFKSNDLVMIELISAEDLVVKSFSFFALVTAYIFNHLLSCQIHRAIQTVH